ncbi:myotubularin-related protein 10 [Pteropus vampyrus]|uniref:Myotubularin-related protein 10 n=1 Tax=Pteropus vampyrus TaxID=132908 RepID=A0A6P6BTN2_PTEVA|nr:myotubularin-related protein 10 [Pteropus vampyrus]
MGKNCGARGGGVCVCRICHRLENEVCLSDSRDGGRRANVLTCIDFSNVFQPDDQINSDPKKKLEPVLLPGEIVVNEVSFVRKCIATDTSQYDLWGKLICTNFKISFITDDPMPLQKFHYRNLLLGDHDVPLTCIEQIVTVNDHKRKQKVLGPNQKLKFNPTELIIYCKDFRIVRFRFDESGPESAKKVCLAIAHYSQPTDLQLLFAFEYVGKKYHNSDLSVIRADWWHFRWKRFSPGYRSVPRDELISVETVNVTFLAGVFGAFLKHSVELVCVLEDRRVSVILQDLCVRVCVITCLCDYVFIVEPFEETEEKWLSSLESTRWLEYVRAFLKHSVELVCVLEDRRVSVILQEEEGRDLSCVVASLVQVMLDPYFRTITGFQSLIQKEWVMAGYQFLDRCNHLKRSEKEEFAMSKNIQLGDEKGLKFPSVWDWSLQFTARDRTLFRNPSYVGKSAPRLPTGSAKASRRAKKTYSSTLRGPPPSLENGLARDRESLLRRNSLTVRGRPDAPQQGHGRSGGPSAEQFFQAWSAKPPDPHGVLLPCLSGAHARSVVPRDVPHPVAVLLLCVLPVFLENVSYAKGLEGTWIRGRVRAGSARLVDGEGPKREAGRGTKRLAAGVVRVALCLRSPGRSLRREQRGANIPPPTVGGLDARPGQSRGHTESAPWGGHAACAATVALPPPRCRWAGKAQAATPPLSPVQKTYSSTLRGPPPSLENGLARDRESLLRRNSLTVRGRPDAPQQGHGQSGGPSAEQFFQAWSAKPPDPHGVLLPCLSGAHVKLWKLCYFRWVPEAQIRRGGSITAFHKLSLLADEVDVLGRALRQQRAGPLEACYAGPPQSRMYFQASGPLDAAATPDFLSSSFPFSPVGNLCRRSISGTPLSKFLSGAKIWLSTETLASED